VGAGTGSEETVGTKGRRGRRLARVRGGVWVGGGGGINKTEKTKGGETARIEKKGSAKQYVSWAGCRSKIARRQRGKAKIFQALGRGRNERVR